MKVCEHRHGESDNQQLPNVYKYITYEEFESLYDKACILFYVYHVNES